MLFEATLTFAFAIAPVLAIPPPEFGFVDSGNHTELSVAYSFNDNTTVVQEGQLFGGNITSSQPALALDPASYQSVADYTGQYIILMVDPDASTPDNPTKRFILHWLAANITQSDTVQTPQVGRQLTNATENFVPYAPPAPPVTSSAHRYILYAFQQPDNFVIPEAFTGFSASNRTNFNLTMFIEAASLDRPAAGEYYYVSREESVPGDFIALAKGEYPGGNGNAIFEGSATATSSASSESSSSTASSSETSSGAEAASTGTTSGDGSTGDGTGAASSNSSGNAASTSRGSVGIVGVLAVGILSLIAIL